MKKDNFWHKDTPNEEKIKIIKPLLLRYYNENKKFDSRGIDKCDYLPSFQTIIKCIKKFNNTLLKYSCIIYDFMDIPIPTKYYDTYFNRDKYTYEEIQKIFEDNKCELLSRNFKNVYTIVDYICSCGNISKIQIEEFLNGHRCSKCGLERRSEKRRKSYDELKTYYLKYGCELLSSQEDYENVNSQLTYICSCGRLFTSSFSCFRLTHNCKQCGIDKISGENHYEWKGGITPIHEYLRTILNPWKIDSAKKDNYKCVITGKTMDTIHHLYPFSNIMDECISILGFKIKSNMNDYSKEELDNLKQVCLDLHYKYGLGVCLTEETHKLFHYLYGRNGTIQDFEEFRVRYKLGEFDNVLKYK